MLSKSKVWNPVSEKHDLYCSECKVSYCNVSACYIQECANFLTSNGYNWKLRCHLNIFAFYRATHVMVIPYALAKQ